MGIAERLLSRRYIQLFHSILYFSNWLLFSSFPDLFFLFFSTYFSLTAPDKDNQDCYLISPSFGATADQQAFFAIFDGHGKDGHHCARFARDHVSDFLFSFFSLSLSLRSCVYYDYYYNTNCSLSLFPIN
jgi:hypothetical protein